MKFILSFVFISLISYQLSAQEITIKCNHSLNNILVKFTVDKNGKDLILNMEMTSENFQNLKYEAKTQVFNYENTNRIYFSYKSVGYSSGFRELTNIKKVDGNTEYFRNSSQPSDKQMEKIVTNERVKIIRDVIDFPENSNNPATTAFFYDTVYNVNDNYFLIELENKLDHLEIKYNEHNNTYSIFNENDLLYEIVLDNLKSDKLKFLIN